MYTHTNTYTPRYIQYHHMCNAVYWTCDMVNTMPCNVFAFSLLPNLKLRNRERGKRQGNVQRKKKQTNSGITKTIQHRIVNAAQWCV